MRRRYFEAAVGTLLLMGIVSCSNSTTAPSPPPATVPHASVAIASIAVTGESVSGGFRYVTTLKLRESTGVAATIVAVDLTFSSAGTTVVVSHHDKPISDGSNVCPASGTIDTRQLETIDQIAGHSFATLVHAVVSFSDGSAYSGTAVHSAEVPPLATPTPPQTFSLVGVITDGATRAPIAGARLEALNGENAGKAATTDATGAYTLTGLVAETFRLRASAAGYDPGEQNVTVPTNPRADFELRRTAEAACNYTGTSNAPAAIGYAGGEFTITLTRTAGTCGWQAAADGAWITFPHGAAGNGSATLTYDVAANGLNTRNGTITISWSGGATAIAVVQGPHPDWECFVSLSKGPEDFDHVPSGGGTVTVSASVYAVPSGWTCTATVAASVPWIAGGGTITSPTMMTFTVAANPSPGLARSGTITIQSGPKSASQTVTQR